MTHRLLDLPHSCEHLTKILQERFPQVTAVFTGRAGTSIWAEAIESVTEEAKKFRKSVQKEPYNFLQEARSAERSFIQVTFVGCETVEEEERLLDSVFDKRTPTQDKDHESLLYSNPLLQGQENRALYTLISEKDEKPFHYLADFDSPRQIRAHRVRSSVPGLYLTVIDPAYIIADTIKTLTNVQPHSDIIAWTTLIIVRKMFRFVQDEFPSEKFAGSPWDDKKIRKAILEVESLGADGAEATRWIQRIEHGISRIKDDSPVWQRALLKAVHFFCMPHKSRVDNLDTTSSGGHAAEFPLWPEVLSNFIAQERSAPLPQDKAD